MYMYLNPPLISTNNFFQDTPFLIKINYNYSYVISRTIRQERRRQSDFFGLHLEFHKDCFHQEDLEHLPSSLWSAFVQRMSITFIVNKKI